MTDIAEYQRGYAAGRRRGQEDTVLEGRHERVYLKCLELALEHCSLWSVNDEKIQGTEEYCIIAEMFTDKSITAMNRLVKK